MTAQLLDRRVGFPIHETAITDALTTSANSLLRPGSGRRLFVCEEVEIGVGRPDVVLIAASPAALRARRERNLRFHNLTEARVFVDSLGLHESGYSSSHRKAVQRRLEARGLFERDAIDLLMRSTVDSLIIEAKVQDWRCGINQLSRTRSLAHRSAIAMPVESVHRVRENAVSANRLGIIGVDSPKRAALWLRAAPAHPISVGSELWLLEIASRNGGSSL